MNHLEGEGTVSNLVKYMYEISRIKVAGTSISQLLGNEIIEQINSAVGCQSPCPNKECLKECKCCLHWKNVIIEIQNKIKETAEADDNDDDETVGNKQLLEDIRENKAKKLNKNAKDKNDVKGKKRTRDETVFNCSSSQSASACMKNISYSSKIPDIESPNDLQKKKKSSSHVPEMFNFSFCDSIPGSSKPPNPVKKLYQKENTPEHGLRQVGSTSGKEVSTTPRFYNW